jgi:hypothetical protein
MSEHLHDMDGIFKSAYQRFSEEPTAEVWKEISAALDKKDAESYKKRAFKWKRVSLLLLVLMAGLILYETMILPNKHATFRKES